MNGASAPRHRATPDPVRATKAAVRSYRLTLATPARPRQPHHRRLEGDPAVGETATACDCPAAAARSGGHDRVDHANDCGLSAGLRCGSCWGCVARMAVLQVVLAGRGQRTDTEEPAA